MTRTVESVNEPKAGWHVCAECGYLARSWPWAATDWDEETDEPLYSDHECPECHNNYWLSVQGFGRPMREQIARDGRWDLKWRTSAADYEEWEASK